MLRLTKKIADDEKAGSTVEWLLVTGAVVVMCGTLSMLINAAIDFIFTRTALIIASPLG